MKKAAGWTSLVAVSLAFAVAIGAHGCGNGRNSSKERRERERCESCDPAQIASDCVSQCVPFCAPDDADCTDRCNRECDRCKGELECHACVSNCTGTVSRCAPADAALTCADGVF